MVQCWSGAICVSVLFTFFFHIQHNPPEINCLREIKKKKKRMVWYGRTTCGDYDHVDVLV